MSSDDLLRQLARVAREDTSAEEADPRWEKLTDGTLTPSEEAALRQLADGDAEASHRYEAHRPLTEGVKAGIASRIATGMAQMGAVQPAPRRLWPRVLMIATPLAAAAAGVLLWMARAPGEALPPYELTWTGGDRATRSAEPQATSGEATVQRDSRIELVLRPASPVAGAVGARGFLVQAGEARPWTPPVEVSPDGAVRIAGRADHLLGVPPGTWDIAVAVGRPEALPTDTAEIAAEVGGERKPHAWQLFVRRVRVVEGL